MLELNGCGPFCLPPPFPLKNPCELSNQTLNPPNSSLCVSIHDNLKLLLGKSRINQLTMMMNTSAYIFLLYFLMMFIIVFFSLTFQSGDFLHLNGDANTTLPHLQPEEAAYFKHRKLMLHGVCSKWDISISQSRYPTSGIPEFIVQIVNTCVSGCAPSNIHLRCGWFASTRIVNPRIFKRLSFDDCLVNGGRPLKTSQSIRFTYANSFMYPLQFKSASFC